MKLTKSAALAALLTTSLWGYAADKTSEFSSAPEEHLISLDAEARLDWQYISYDAHKDPSQTGFIGKYIALKAHGQIINGLTYTWRQRFSRTPKDGSFWDQTDILDLNYKYGKFDFGVGKQVVLIGGYEYNRAPIELMCPNLFVANIACYQFGVSAGWQISPSDHLAFQVTQSPYALTTDRDMYAFNLQWSGNHKISDKVKIETIWSVNEVEYTKGKFCNYVALGNKLVIDKVSLVADIMVRSYPENSIFKNNTFMGEASWDINKRWKITGKVSYDCNRGKNKTPYTEVARGSQIATGGLVAEWFPIRKDKYLLKFHAAAFYARGTNKNPDDMLQNKMFYGSLGVTWHMNILNFK